MQERKRLTTFYLFKCFVCGRFVITDETMKLSCAGDPEGGHPPDPQDVERENRQRAKEGLPLLPPFVPDTHPPEPCQAQIIGSFTSIDGATRYVIGDNLVQDLEEISREWSARRRSVGMH